MDANIVVLSLVGKKLQANYRAQSPSGPGHRSGHPTNFHTYLDPPSTHHHNDSGSCSCRDKVFETRRIFFVPEAFSYQKLAEKHRCSRTTLTEHHRGRRTTRAESHEHQRLLHQRDEAELVQYIRRVTVRHCPPTRQMIINIATPLCQ